MTSADAVEYTLPSIVTVNGTFAVTVYSEFADLIKPTIQTITQIGDTRESANIALGQTEIGNMQISIRDDSSTYTYGFWYKVLSGETWLKILLDDAEYFFGTVQADTVSWDENYISGTTRIRTCEFIVASMTQKLFDTPTATWLTHAYDNRELTGYVASTPAFSVISLTGFFSALLSASGVNAAYAKDDTGFQCSTTVKDLEFLYDGSWYALNYVWLLVTYDSGAGEAKVDYFDSAEANYLATKYVTAKELINALCKNFGVIFRAYYDPVADRHKIQILQGRAYDDADNLDFSSREKSSALSKSTDLLGDAVRCTSLYAGEFVWFSRKYLGSLAADFSEAAPEDYVKFDMDFYVPYLVYDLAPDTSGYPIYAGSVATAVGIATDVRYFRYDGLGVTTASATGTRKMLEAAAGITFSRFTTVNSSIVRVYGKMLAKVGAGADAHTSLTVMRRTSIDDGLGAVTYWANTVIKKPQSADVEIQWLKE